MTRRRKELFLAAMVVLALEGCFAFGPRVEEFGPATHPRGVSIEIGTRSGALRGELLEVRDSAFLVLDQTRRVVVVPFATIRRAAAEGIQVPVVADGRGPTPANRQRLRLTSRFPQGLSPELMQALLAAYGQREPEVMQP